MLLKFPAKSLRARVIKNYLEEAGLPGCVCFSCGNASRALADAGVAVVDVSPTGGLSPNRWWTPAEIRRTWPHLLDATSGHLPVPLTVEVARVFRAYLGVLEPGRVYEVPSGSGETIQCLRWAYPELEFVPVFDCGPGTEYDARSPLASVVRGLGVARKSQPPTTSEEGDPP